MKKKGVRVMVGLVLVCLLAGMLGVYSASARTEIGLTYRRLVTDWGGVKFYTQSGFGGELLVDYYGYSCQHSKDTHLDLQPSLLYRFNGSSGTSPYVGIGYYSHSYTYENWGNGVDTESGFCLLVGMEHFFSKGFSIDLRITAYSTIWKDVWSSGEDHGTMNGLYANWGINFYR